MIEVKGEWCYSCGEPYETVWKAPDHIWKAASLLESDGLYCLNCFDRKARAAGINIYWSCDVGKYPKTTRINDGSL